MTFLARNRSLARARNAGFSLVELMVAVVIGLIGSVVIFQVFEVSEGQKRTTTGAGDSQQYGTLALYSIERDIRMAGYGINVTALLGCTVNAYYAGPPASTFNFMMVPVSITKGVGNAPDSIALMYGNSNMIPGPAQLTQTMPNPSAVFKVNNRYGFTPGDLIIVAQPGSNCALAQATGVPGGGASQDVIHNSGNYTNASGTNVPAMYNPSGGNAAGVSYAAYDPNTGNGGQLYDIGAAPTVVTYAVANGQLTMTNTLTQAAATPIVDGVVQLKAQYGKDNGVNNGTVTHATYVADDGMIDSFDSVAPTTAAGWAEVIAIRLAIVARSAQPERPNPATGVCATTTAAPTWAGTNATTGAGGTNPADPLVLTADPNWQCYRYKTFETVVPIRNMIWKPS